MFNSIHNKEDLIMEDMIKAMDEVVAEFGCDNCDAYTGAGPKFNCTRCHYMTEFDTFKMEEKKADDVIRAKYGMEVH